MRINDFHVHVGQFNDLYFSPDFIRNFLSSVGVDSFAVSSSSICGHDIDQTLHDIKVIVSLFGEKAFPVLWITPEMLLHNFLKEFLESGIDWKCVKIHGYHNWTQDNIETAVFLAQALKVPLMMHTGGQECCEAGQYYSLCKKFPHQLFVLAHSRPCDETIFVMEKCKNVWADTAFTPVEDIVKMVNAGLEDRILWGSDYPILELYYKKQNIRRLYLEKIEALSQILDKSLIEKILYLNFHSLWRTSNNFIN